MSDPIPVPLQPMPTSTNSTPMVRRAGSRDQDRRSEEPRFYYGYEGFSNFMTRDPDYFMLRRFEVLNVRTMLSMQDEIAALEENLSNIDKSCAAARLDNGTFRNDKSSERVHTMAELRTKLKEYNSYILTYKQLEELRRPQPRLIRGVQAVVKNWLVYSHPNVIASQETKFLCCEEDLVTIYDKPKSQLERFLAYMFLCKASTVTWLTNQVRDGDIVYYEYPGYRSQDVSRATDSLLSLVAPPVGVALLIGPLWWLEYETDQKKKLGIASGFTILFLALLNAVTVGQTFNTLAATLAYAAVLMVFLQLGSQQHAGKRGNRDGMCSKGVGHAADKMFNIKLGLA